MRDEPPEVDRFIRRTAQADGPSVIQHLPQDPAQAGKAQVDHHRQILQGPLIGPVEHDLPIKDKITRAQPLARALEQGRVHYVVDPWYDRVYRDPKLTTTVGALLWSHVDPFPAPKVPGKPMPKDDFVDVCADGFTFFEARRPYVPMDWSAARARLTRRPWSS